MNSNSIGSIHARTEKRTGKKVYDVHYRVYDIEKGEKVKHMKRGFKYKREAQQFLDEIAAQVKEDRYIAPQTITVEEVALEWFDKHKVKIRPHTQSWYWNNVKNHIIPTIGHLPIQKLTVPILQQMYDQKQEDGLSATSISYINRTMKMIFQHAIRKRYVSVNIASDPDLSFGKKEEPEMKILVYEEIVHVLKDVIPWTSPVAVPFALGGLMGLRRGEVLGLRWSDIDFKEKKLSVIGQRTIYDEGEERSELKTKNSKRVLPIPDLVCDMLVYQKAKQFELADILGYDKMLLESGYVCCYMDAQHFATGCKPTYFNRVFSKALKEYNLPDMRFHDLRHSYATNLLHMDIPLLTVSGLMGHSSPDITLRIYAHAVETLNHADFQKVNDKINQLANGAL